MIRNIPENILPSCMVRQNLVTEKDCQSLDLAGLVWNIGKKRDRPMATSFCCSKDHFCIWIYSTHLKLSAWPGGIINAYYVHKNNG